MPRAKGNDLAELFGYAPDDTSVNARKQWKSQECPFVGGICIKHSHPQGNKGVTVFGSCSVLNHTRNGVEEVIICPNRLYADDYETLKNCIYDAIGHVPKNIFMAHAYSALKQAKKLPNEYFVLLGHNSGKEVQLKNPVISMSLDWVMVWVKDGKTQMVIPCEVQSIDITGNYHANWIAYSQERDEIPNSAHGMNWANVWKRLIPQLMIKSSIAATSGFCSKGIYFVLPERVYQQFEKIIGEVPKKQEADHGILTIMTYELGKEVPFGKIRKLVRKRIVRMLATDLAKAFASGEQLPLGTQLDEKVKIILAEL